MSIETAIREGMVARAVAEEIVTQREARMAADGASGAAQWINELKEEAISFLVQLRVPEDEARRDLEKDMAEEEDQQRFLETFVAEARVIQRIDKTEEVARKMHEDKAAATEA